MPAFATRLSGRRLIQRGGEQSGAPHDRGAPRSSSLSDAVRRSVYLSCPCQGHPRLLHTSRLDRRVPLLESTSCLNTASSHSGHLVPVFSPGFPALGVV